MNPPPGIKQLLDTYILERTVRQLAAPLVLHLGDLSGVLVIKDVDPALDGLFLRDTFGHITSLQIHADWVTGADDFMVQTLDFGEGCLETILQEACEPYPPEGWSLLTHWGSNCFRPVAMVMLSSNTPLSSHKESFFKEGRPAKSYEHNKAQLWVWMWEKHTSRTDPTKVCWCSSRVTPLAVLMLVFSMPRSEPAASMVSY